MNASVSCRSAAASSLGLRSQPAGELFCHSDDLGVLGQPGSVLTSLGQDPTGFSLALGNPSLCAVDDSLRIRDLVWQVLDNIVDGREDVAAIDDT
jgi:hypothetical protein